MRTLLRLCAATALLSFSTPALSWGQIGHRVVGEIAQDRISGRTATEIEHILNGEDLAEISTWADEERSNPDPFWQREAGPWHYVTVPQGHTYQQVGAPPEGDAVTALARFSAVLRNRQASREERALALHFIVHIVADLHQPLHAGREGDRGGNAVAVTWFGEETNLHSVWDTGMIEGQNLSYTEYTIWLERGISAEETLQWWDADPLTWIAESVALRETIYPQAANGPARLGYEYQYRHLHSA